MSTNPLLTLSPSQIWGNQANNPISSLMLTYSPNVIESLALAPISLQEKQLNQTLSQVQAASSAWSQLQADASAVMSQLTTLSSGLPFDAQSASSSSPSVATAAASSEAASGSFGLTVNQLAQAEVDHSAVFSSATQAANISGTFTIALGPTSGTSPTTTSASVTITSGMTLEQIASAINSSAGQYVKAAVQDTANGYQLVVQANQPNQFIYYGESSSTSILNNGSGELGLVNASSGGTVISSGTSNNNTEAVAQPAEYTLGNTTLQANSNTISNIVPGVTAQLLSVGTTTITVGPNVSQMESSITKFQKDWNQLVQDVNTLTLPVNAGPPESSSSSSSSSSSYKSNSHQVISSPQPLAFVQQAQTALGETVAQTAAGPLTMADVGLQWNYSAQDGTLSWDPNGSSQISANLSTLLTTHPHSVASYFQKLSKKLMPILQVFAQGSTSVSQTAQSSLETEINSLTLQKQNLAAEAQSVAKTARQEYLAMANSITGALGVYNYFQNVVLGGPSSSGGGFAT
ncbi:flagellar filament capping protein FliD [Sulfobacillus thermosulfidooxidans]|uniref:flagellar filament capping protein FliD n=1 Tax=Sulfobacillus thermosulfidooxidans TaxID=28034 RepID=UPI0006B5F0E9|nr:flagellar filament capping protein FliD [Sulfobacillus thermosulfidooxidans]